MKTAQYEAHEASRFHTDLKRVETLSLRDRKEARQALIETLDQTKRDLVCDGVDLFLERCAWLLNGSYGYGSQAAFKRLSTRCNRNAWLFVTTAALEWQCPSKFAVEVWKGLSVETQDRINAGLDKAINNEAEVCNHNRQPMVPAKCWQHLP